MNIDLSYQIQPWPCKLTAYVDSIFCREKRAREMRCSCSPPFKKTFFNFVDCIDANSMIILGNLYNAEDGILIGQYVSKTPTATTFLIA